MTTTYVVRVWLPDRPGALGQVASAIGAVGGDVVGIEILERGGGHAVDDLVVELPTDVPVGRMVAAIRTPDGVQVEDLRIADAALFDPRVDALELVAQLTACRTIAELLDTLCERGSQVIGANWAAVVGMEEGDLVASVGPTPTGAWLAAFVGGSRASVSVGAHSTPDDVVWAPLPGADLALVMGREGTPYRARERRSTAALARICDTRCRELSAGIARREHPAGSRPTR